MAVTSSNTDLHGFGEAIRRELGSRIPRDERMKVLDVGTGFGINVAYLARWLSKGSTVWTVDPSREVLEDVRALLGREDARRVKFVEAAADDLPFEDGAFDAVVSVMVLHHIEKLQPALREMARVLGAGGTMLIVDYRPEASHELEFGTRHEEEDFFTPEQVAGRLRRLGMEPVQSDHGVWYLVEAKRPSVPRRGARAGRARPRAAG